MHFSHPTDLLKLSFGSNWIQKTKRSIYETSRMLFSNMDFNFAHFTNSNFAHFEMMVIRVNLGKITNLVKLQNV